jgi:hypothetical protein
MCCTQAATAAAAAHCLQLSCTTQRHAAVISQFGVSLDWQDLRHLLLADRTATDAALAVGSYLQRFSKPGKELFSLRNKAATFAAAEQYAESDHEMRKLLQLHHEDCRARCAAHAHEVQRKKDLVAEIRSELQDLRSRVSQLKSASNAEYSYSVRHQSARYHQLVAETYSVNSQINNKEAEEQAALESPEAVIQPIPKSPSLARRWLFFLHMPPLLQRLARASCLSQQLLLPAAAAQHVAVTDLQQYSLAVHSNECAGVATYYASSSSLRAASDGPDGSLLLRSSSPAPPGRTASSWNGTTLNPKNIDRFHNDSDGVWWPDQLVLSMGWQGSSCAADRLPSRSGGFFDPFAGVPSSIVVEAFTEQLGDHDASAAVLQWAMPQYGSVAATAAERGNLGDCRQEAGAPDVSSYSLHMVLCHSAVCIPVQACASLWWCQYYLPYGIRHAGLRHNLIPNTLCCCCCLLREVQACWAALPTFRT